MTIYRSGRTGYGSTPTYRLEENGEITVTDSSGSFPVCKENGRPLRTGRSILATPKNGVYVERLDGSWWEIKRDDIAYPTTKEAYEAESKFNSKTDIRLFMFGPLADW